jgi:putative DNA primase/helicase
MEDEELRGRAYRFLEGKCSVRTDKKGGVSHIPINPTRAMVSDILDAMNARCLIAKDPPLWLRWTGKSDPSELIAFKNGILDTKKYLSGADDYFYPATPEFFTLTSIPHVFSPDTQLDPEIQDKLIEILVDEDKILLLQEWAGYLLLASQKYEKMMLFVGPKRAGKGTLLDLLSAMVGSGQVASTSFRSLSGSFGYSTLVGKLLAIMPDASIPREVDGVQVLETIKQITGGDGVNINRKYRDEIPFVKLVSRFVIAVNTLPELPDYAKTLESRLNIVRFTESFEGREDRNLKQRLSGKANTIIPWALEGLKRLQEQGAFTIPESSGATMNEFVSISSPFGDFISETCRLKEGVFLNRNQLYDCWLGWASREGQRKISHPTFRQRFLSLYLDGVKGETKMIDGHKVIGYKGIQITKAAKREFLEIE